MGSIRGLYPAGKAPVMPAARDNAVDGIRCACALIESSAPAESIILAAC
ncbi:MAG: hypothetical protein ACLVJ6_06110 [Merdibacter sp.]